MDLRILTAKDVSNELSVSIDTAEKYIKDIKAEFNIKASKITMQNLINYFGL